jgi:hypothetical protein
MTKPETNHAAFHRLKPEIDRRFPEGHWVAIEDGRLIADAPTVDQLEERLRASEQDSAHVFVARARVDYDQDVDILLYS